MKKSYLIFVFGLIGFWNLAAQNLEIFVSSRAENAIKQYDQNGVYLGDFITANSGNLTSPQDIIFLNDNTVIVSGIQNTSIKQYDADTGNYIGDFTSGFAINQPTRMKVKDNLLYVVQWGVTNNKVVRFDLNGNFIDEFTSIGISQGIGIDWDNAGNLYVSSWGQGTNGFVQKFDPFGNDLGQFIDSSILQGPTNIWFDINQNLLVEDWSLGLVRRFSSTGQYIDDFITGMTNPEGIAFFPNGDLLICDWGTDTVERFDSNGNSLGTIISGNNLGDPNAVVIRDPNLSVTDYQTNNIFVTPTVGSLFKINPDIASRYDFFQLFDTNGRLVDNFNLSEGLFWDISKLDEGLYFILGFDNETRVTQKIILKR